MNWQTKIITAFCILASLALILIWPAIQTELVIFFRVLLIVSAISLVGFLLLVGSIGRENYLLRRAQRKQSEYILHNDGYGMAHLIGVNGQSRNLTTHDSDKMQQLVIMSKITASKQLPDSPLLLPEPKAVDVLPALDNVQCGLIVGQRESGKTTLLQWLISRRLDKSSVVILDPHSHPTRWPAGCTVMGTGRDFDAIGQALAGLQNLMNKRYREIGKGQVKEGEHKRITVVIDEWRAIVRNLGKEAGDIIAALLAESRKINIDVFVGTHSERVKALGIEGEGDLKEGFVMVRLTINKSTKERQCTIDYGDGPITASLPGPYIGLNPFSPDEDENILELPTPEIDKDNQFAELVKAGMSRRKASLQVYGRTYAGDIVERGQRALGEI